MMRWNVLFALVVGMAVAACGDDDDETPVEDTTTATDTSDVGGDTTTTGDADATAGTDVADTEDVVTPAGPKCDPLDPSFCSLPWPSNLYLEADAERATGYTLAFADGLPRNLADKPIDGEMFRRMDGYGVGDPLMVHFANVDVTGMATEWDLAPSLADDAPILWYEVGDDDALTRVPYFIDVDVAQADPAQRVLIVRPGVILKEATRYVVAFRNLQDTDGDPIAASSAFAALRDGATASDPALAPRQARFDEVFALLATDGVAKADLTLAWDFVTASSEALHGPMLHMRDAALAAVGEDGAELTITEMKENTPEENANWWLEIQGTFRTPNFMMPVDSGTTAGTVYYFNEGADGLPEQDGWSDDAVFWVRVPHSAKDGTPHGLIQYGHGQNGRGSQVGGGFNGQIANDHHYIFFACDMLGMSELDVGGIVDMLADLSGFRRLSDRLHQGMINHLVLARGMRERFEGMTEIAAEGIQVDESKLFYSGISQGGIYGGTYMALSTEITRGHLGVPGNQYAYLLFRSRNFEPFFALLSAYYEDRTEQLVTIQAIQQLWNMADPVSYLRHLHDPFPGNTESSVMLVPAKGDVQVAVSANEIAARSDIGIAVLENYDTERSVSLVTPVSYPHTGSGVVLYSFGNPWPNESENRPPTSDVADPHGKPRQLVNHNAQMVHFFETGEIIDVCSDDATPGCTPE